MDIKQKIERLREEATKNKVANAMFCAFAVRQRARLRINLSSLTQKMKNEGFDYRPSDYVPILRLLAELGFGTLDIDNMGRVRGLKDIKTTLQSIGKAACGQGVDLDKFKERNRFHKLHNIPEVKKEEKQPLLNAPEVNISLPVKGRTVKVSIPSGLDAKEIAAIIEGIQRQQAG